MVPLPVVKLYRSEYYYTATILGAKARMKIKPDIENQEILVVLLALYKAGYEPMFYELIGKWYEGKVTYYVFKKDVEAIAFIEQYKKGQNIPIN